MKRLSISAIKKKEPADYEPPHSAGIAYPSIGLGNGLLPLTQLKIIQYGIVQHRKYLHPVPPFDDYDDFQYDHLEMSVLRSLIVGLTEVGPRIPLLSTQPTHSLPNIQF